MKDILVKEIMSTNLATLSPYDTLSTAKKIFDTKKIHHIPIIFEEKLVGILSNTDLERSKQGKTLFINHDVAKHNETILESTLTSMVMTEMVETVTSSESIFNVYSLFKAHQFRSLPVLENGKIVGIVTPMDFLDYFFNENEK